MIIHSFYKTTFSIAHTTHRNALVCYRKRGKVLAYSKAHIETGLWLFVYECDSQPPRGVPHIQKHTEIHITEKVTGVKFIITELSHIIFTFVKLLNIEFTLATSG